MKLKNKICVIIITLFFLIFLIFLIIGIVHFFSSYTATIFINYGISLPKPKNEDKKFLIDYREGDEFIILKYNKKDVNSIIKKRTLKKVTDSNIKELKEKIEYFYERLDEKEKSIFDSSITIPELTNKDNYYALYEQDKCHYGLFILYKYNLYVIETDKPCGIIAFPNN